MSDIYSFGPFRLDRISMRLLREESDLGLRRQVVQLLKVLMEQAGTVVRYGELGRLAWGQDVVERRTIIVTVNELTTALCEYGSCVLNTPGVGYRFENPDLGPRLTNREPARQVRVVLMPFEDRTRDGGKAYLAGGLNAELATALSKIEGVRVIKATEHTLQFLPASDTESDYLFEGTIAGEGEKLKFHFQLMTSHERAVVWGESYSPSVNDLGRLQSSIATRIGDAIKVRINIEELNRMHSEKAVDPATYKLYLRGLFHWSRPTEVDLFRAIEYFREASSRDQQYAQAFGGMAHAYGLLGLGGFLRPDSAMPQAEIAALRCLEISPGSPEGLSALAAVEAYFRWNWSRAEELLKRAIQANGQYDTAHHLYAMGCLMPQGKLDDAAREIRKAEAISPLSPFVVTCTGIVEYYSRRYSSAMPHFDRALELQPHFHLAHWHRGWALAQLRRFDEAIDGLQAAVKLSQDAPQVLAALGHVYAAAGKRREARRILRELRQVAEDRYVSPYDLALIYVSMGDGPKALALLTQALEQRVPAMARLPLHPALDPLRRHSHFKQLLKELNLLHCSSTPSVGKKGSDPQNRKRKSR